jgi:hypothetical protein
VHGRIVRGLELTVLADGLARPASVGESIRVPVGTEVTAALELEVPPTDWQQQPNRIDAVEFIVITPDKVDTRVHQTPNGGSGIVAEKITIVKEGAVVRARVRRVVPDGPDLMAYTNAIRIHGQ